MGLRGPPNQSNEELELRGSRHKRASPDAIIEPMEELPKPPKTLKLSGKKLWNSLLPRLKKAGVLTIVDMEAFERMCQAYQDWKELKEKLNEINIYDEAGNPRQLHYVCEKLEKKLNDYAKMFGLTPLARGSIRATAESDEKESDGLID